ncbi:MAG: HAMP domain-containing protein [Lachnospiraceae bacterium]|jgi:methyl-accepting chemotaxis protein|nr:HAMP domain-containing protein [Lachnospiraceae bacterium]
MKESQTSQNGQNAKYRRIGQKVGNVVIIMQIISIVLAVTVCILMFRSLITKMHRERCTNGTNMLALELSRASGDEDMNQILDELKSRMGCEFTIFEGDTRAYSTVIQDGRRAVGTKLSADLSAIVLQQGQSYVGETTILGESYLCSYVPVKGPDGKISGLIFAGISTAEAKRETIIVIALAALMSLITIGGCILFLSSYLKKQVSAPLRKITQAAQQLEKGELGLSGGGDVRVDIHSNDEIGTLGRIFEDTIRRLQSYIGEITTILSAIAGSDLTVSTSQDYIGDFQSIKQSLEQILRALNSTMSQIATSASHVAEGSEGVSGSAQSLAQGATEQASSVEEISATLADISANARSTSTAAVEAGSFVNQAGAQLGTSIEYVKDLNVAMENISNSSSEISTIIATIENIAFQINILSLNASVEAARAGSAGKGFAVVADEVRNLAAKSDQAAKATKELIDNSIAAIAEGARAVEQVTDSLERTSQIAGNVTTQVALVVESVEKQTVAISQVAEGVDQISTVVQTNSATSEECAAASEELSSQAGLLKNLIGAFRLKR